MGRGLQGQVHATRYRLEEGVTVPRKGTPGRTRCGGILGYVPSGGIENLERSIRQYGAHEMERQSGRCVASHPAASWLQFGTLCRS